MQQVYYCPNCGSVVAYGVKFCGNCSNPLSWPAHQQMQPPPVYQQPHIYQQQQWGYHQQPSNYQHWQYRYGWQPPQKQSSSSWLVILLVAVVVLFIVGAYFILTGGTSLFPASTNPSDTSLPATTQEPTETPEPEPTVTEISAKELIEAYEVDAEAAKEQYNGKLLIVTGVVDSMEIGSATPYVLLTGGGPHLTGAKCMFDAQDASKLFQIEIGETIKVQGKVGEYAVDVIVNDCAFVQ